MTESAGNPKKRWIKLIAVIGPFLLIALTALGWYLTDLKGQRDLDHHFARMRALGLETNPALYFQRTAPTEDDVFQHPAMMAELRVASGVTAPAIEDKLVKLAPGSDHQFRARKVYEGKQLDITLFDYSSGIGEKEIAERLLFEIKPQTDLLYPLNAALRRPIAAWPFRWEKSGDMPVRVPDLTNGAMIFVKLSMTESRLLLISSIAGDRSAACEWADGQIQMQRHFQSEPSSLILGTVSTATFSILYSSFWEASMRGVFLDEDYREFEQKLSKLNMQDRMVNALKGELIFGSSFSKLDDQARSLRLFKGWKWDGDVIWKRTRGVVRSVRPLGIVASKQVAAWSEMLKLVYREDGVQRTHLDLDTSLRFKRLQQAAPLAIQPDWAGGVSEGKDTDMEMYQLISSYLISGLASEAQVALMRSGIALERYRLLHGSYPDSLEMLVPEYLPGVLNDPLDDAPLRYQKNGDGSALIWSIGKDGVDDGGRPLINDKGDVVWVARQITR